MFRRNIRDEVPTIRKNCIHEYYNETVDKDASVKEKKRTTIHG